jgi:hypothetical protein
MVTDRAISTNERGLRLQMLTLTALALILPFELKTPLITVGPIVITNVEAMLYATVAVWGLNVLRARRIDWTPAHWGAATWAAALMVTALAAPTERDAALKFALRGLGGVLVFMAAASLPATSCREAVQHSRPVLAALAVGAGASAMLGIVEVIVPGASAVLSIFKTGPSLIGNFLRASGSFQYANTAAMYWEAALPPVLGLGLWQWRRTRRRRRLILSSVMALMLMEAIVLSASRAALLAAALGLAALIVFGIKLDRGKGRSGWPKAAALSLLAMSGLTGIQLIISPWLALRVKSENDADWYRAVYAPANTMLTLTAGAMTMQTVAVTNAGVRAWQPDGDQPMALSYHWAEVPSGQIVVQDGRRTPLPRTIAPGETITLTALVQAPLRSGDYILQWDLVQENVIWFSGKTNVTGDVSATVKAGPIDAPPPPTRAAPKLPPPPGRLELWRVAWQLWRSSPLTGIGPDNFRLSYGPLLGMTYFDDRVTANSLYLEILSTMGLIGLGALCVLIGGLMLTARRAWRLVKDEPEKATVWAALLTGVGLFFVHGAVDVFWAYTPTYGLFWLMAGLWTALWRK